MLVDVLGYLRTLLDQTISLLDVATAVWTGLGFTTGLISAALIQRKAARLHQNSLLKSHDFAALSALTQSSSQAAAYSKVVRFIGTRTEAEIPMSAISDNEQLEEQIIVMLGMYQFLAFAADEGLIDKRLVCRQFLPSMRSLVSKLRPFIVHYRTTMNRPAVWSELEEFVRKNS